ncbi:MAG: serine/threonine-protein kinase [Phycisphaerales bacterium]
MTKQAHQDLRRIFERVIELTGAEREAALSKECGGDAELRRRIEAMLAAAESDTQFLAAPTQGEVPHAAPTDVADTAPVREGPGTRIGPYKLLQRIGEGGFGVVFMAEQEHPVRRMVALKVIKLGMDTRSVVARFEQERQALAMMDHPNIAKVLDAGETDSGRPYFVMELVRGVPITEYCDQNMLSARERLELFIPVCHALHHAHQKGIIHRDIKPSNILVTLHDGVPVPKVIDFGIAKATSGRLTEKTLFTEHRQLIGTPAYMSPEQAEMSGLDIDTRSDIYSLGVLLYELLTGTTPFDTQELLRAGYAEIQRIIREVDPPKPSTRVSTMGETLTNVAARRRVEPRRLGAMIRGDLDWIVMKALEKDRTRRYDSASSLAADVRSHLASEPVHAAPPSTAYRFRKFVRRRRGLVAAIGGIAAALVLGVVGTSVSLANARRAAAAERAAHEAELAERMRAERTAGFLREMLSSVDPEAARGREVTVKDILDVAAAKAGSELASEPEVEAAMRHTLGETYNQLSKHRESKEQFLREFDIRTRTAGPEHRDTLAARFGLGVAMLQSGDLDPAREHLSATLATQERVLGEHDPDTVQTRSVYGFAVQLTGDKERALRIYRDVLSDQAQSLGKGNKATLETMTSIADVLQDLGRLDEARTAAEELVTAARDAEGPDGARTLQAQSVLVSILTDLGRYAEAEPLARSVLAAKARIYGDDHGSTIITANALGLVLENLDKFDEAIELLTRFSSSSARTLGPEHATTLTLLANLARNHQLRGNLDEAEQITRRVLEIRRRTSGDTATGTLIVMNNLGLLLLAREKPAEAEPVLREMAAGIEQTMPPDHWMRGQAKINLGRSLAGQSKCAEAESLMLGGYELLAKALPAGHDRLKIARDAIVEMYTKCGKSEQAAKWKAKE